MSYDLAVIIVNYNVSDLLKNCLESVYASTGNISYKVCVVDNASLDQSVAMVQERFPQAHLIANSGNVGYPAANNQGMIALGVHHDAADSSLIPRYVLLLNPDTELPADCLVEYVRWMDENLTVGVVGPRLVLPDGSLDLACRRSFPSPNVSMVHMLGLSRLFPKSPIFGRYNMTYLPEDQLVEVDSVVGAFMLVRTIAIDKVGMLDETFWMYGEDLDWAKRIKDAGWKIIYNPARNVKHIKRASSRQNPKAQFEFNRAMIIFYYRHYRRETSWPMHLLVMLGLAIKGGPKLWPELDGRKYLVDNTLLLGHPDKQS
ncbi:MAG: N-acetylglucosaminyl-diphospho-decaprenol L-rhamnosyltransferase [Cellvibrionaceae bacterium]|jgi:N-acetylglucosaminyl-diphospho-decaprenol L-rhamnosyltransferase